MPIIIARGTCGPRAWTMNAIQCPEGAKSRQICLPPPHVLRYHIKAPNAARSWFHVSNPFRRQDRSRSVAILRFRPSFSSSFPFLVFLACEAVLLLLLQLIMDHRELEARVKALNKTVNANEPPENAMRLLDSLKKDAAPTEEMLRVCACLRCGGFLHVSFVAWVSAARVWRGSSDDNCASPSWWGGLGDLIALVRCANPNNSLFTAIHCVSQPAFAL